MRRAGVDTAAVRRRVRLIGVAAFVGALLWLGWLALWSPLVVIAVFALGAIGLSTAARRVSWLAPVRVAGVALFTASLAFVLLAPLSWGLAKLVLPNFAAQVVSAMFGLLVVLCLFGQWVAARQLCVRTFPVRIPGLGPQLSGLRIVQLSDLHFGGFVGPAQLRRWVARTNELEPDLIVLSGDLTTRGSARCAELCAELAHLHARHATVAVLGNHDVGCAAELTAQLRQAGLEVLSNQSMALQLESERLYIAGFDGTRRHAWDLTASLAERRFDDTSLVISHYPDPASSVARAGVDLMLCGHTHGGQVAFRSAAHFLGLPGLSGPRAPGLQRVSGMWLNQHTGLGTTGLPVRLGLPPELVVLELQPDSESTFSDMQSRAASGTLGRGEHEV